jgi:DNA-binding transcriptional ArsR family regulator
LASPARIRSTLATMAAPPHELSELRAFHKALADVSRLRILQRLAESPATVTDLIEHVGLSQPLVSWHVRTLRQTGLVETRRSGREVICSLRPEQFAAYRRREADLLGAAGT